jgi:hypothetical protein
VQVTGKVCPERGKIMDDIAYTFIWLSAKERINFVQRHNAHILDRKLDPNIPP